MQELFNEKFKVFLGGALAGVFASIKLLFINDNIYVGFGLKLMGAGMIAFVSGILTVFANDVYKHHIKNKFFKNGNQKDDDKTKAA